MMARRRRPRSARSGHDAQFWRCCSSRSSAQHPPRGQSALTAQLQALASDRLLLGHYAGLGWPGEGARSTSCLAII